MSLTLKQYTRNIKNTFQWGLIPFELLAFLGRPSEPENTLGASITNTIMGIFKTLIVLASPVILAIGLMTLSLSLVASAAQTAFLPFHFAYNAIFAKDEPKTVEKTKSSGGAESAPLDVLEEKEQIPCHFAPLFTPPSQRAYEKESYPLSVGYLP